MRAIARSFAVSENRPPGISPAAESRLVRMSQGRIILVVGSGPAGVFAAIEAM
jgi:hypothetical protein